MCSFNIKNAINTFFIESREILNDMETQLLNIEKGNLDEDTLNAIFRGAHTIKGSAGMFSFEDIEGFTHIMESLLDDVRNRKISLDSDLISLLLECKDYIGIMFDFFEKNEGQTLNADMLKTNKNLLERLSKYFPSKTGTNDDLRKVINQCWHISLRFSKNVFKNGLDPQSFISYLEKIGKIIKIITISDALPSLKELDPQMCYLGFEITFKGDVSKEKIEDVFEFVQDDCDIRILPPLSNINEYKKLIDDLPEESTRIGEILKNIGALTESELTGILGIQVDGDVNIENDDLKHFGEIAVEKNLIQRSVVDAALQKQQDIMKSKDSNKKTIRVDAGKLDNLINLIGELVIKSANISQQSKETENIELIESVSEMSRLIEDIRDSTMNVRMVPIGETFRRYERIVRDLSKGQDKIIDLVINGGETELDKTIIEKLTDPLTHLIRNSIDHGIKSKKERLSQGKSPNGKIELNAYHETGSIVIEINDDGNGLDKNKILQKAIERGMIETDQNISDMEIFKLIFEPGFSTADKITNISGRGVGMDVVKKNIESLRGSVILKSEEGIGTNVRIHLPLTLAIIDGLLVKVGEFSYVLPLGAVVECIVITRDEINDKNKGNFINLRGEFLPFMRLREFFEEKSEEPQKENIIVVEYANKKAGLVVDKPMGEFQTVVKPFSKLFKSLQWVSGSTILGDGTVALILDVPKLFKNIQEIESGLING